jgi:RND family efflux transporter MFP subunit
MKLKKTLIWICLVVLIAGGAMAGYFYFNKTPKLEMVTAQVETGTLVQTVDANGVLESLDKVELAFGTTGTAGVILVEVGDEVKAGDLLASLDLVKFEADRASAWQAVEIARANLSQRRAGSTSEAVAVSEAALVSAQAALASSGATTAAAVVEAEVVLTNAEEDLENTKLDNEEDLSEALDDLYQELRDSVITIRSALSEADEVLGIDNSMANDDFQDVLGANDSQSLILAENNYEVAVLSRDAAEDAVYLLSLSSTETEIEVVEVLVNKALADSATTLLYTRRVLDGTNVDTADFSSADLATLETSIDATRSDIQTAEDAILTARQAIDQLKITNTIEETAAENLVDKYQAALASAEVGATYSVAVKQAAVSEAEANLASVMATPRSVDLAALVAAVSQAEANYTEVESRFTDAQIFAPIDGKITAVEFEQGEQVVANTPVVIVQTVTSQFQIAADISESDISKVSLEDPAEITFDAFGDDKKFYGQVAKIDPAEKNIGGVIYYEATIYLDEGTDTSGWKPGLTSDLTITTANIENCVLATQRAVLENESGEKYVRLPQGDSYEERLVTVGLRGDGGVWQILSGLAGGETIIVTIREK